MQDRDKQMIKLHNRGFTYRQISGLFGISRARAHQIVSGYGKLLQQINNKGRYYYQHEYIIDRDDHKCQVCENSDYLIVHHIDGDDRHNKDSNLITLCNGCHTKTHHLNRRRGSLELKSAL